jgi:hypothetical protein
MDGKDLSDKKTGWDEVGKGEGGAVEVEWAHRPIEWLVVASAWGVDSNGFPPEGDAILVWSGAAAARGAPTRFCQWRGDKAVEDWVGEDKSISPSGEMIVTRLLPTAIPPDVVDDLDDHSALTAVSDTLLSVLTAVSDTLLSVIAPRVIAATPGHQDEDLSLSGTRLTSLPFTLSKPEP